MPGNIKDYGSLIQESLIELQKLERVQKLARHRDYVRFLRYLKQGQDSQVSAGARIGLKARQSQNLWLSYQQSGLAALVGLPPKSNVGKLSYVQIGRLQAFLRDATTPLTQQQIADWIEDSFGVRYGQSGISRLFQRLKIKLKTGRPSNVRKDEAGAEALKKTSLS